MDAQFVIHNFQQEIFSVCGTITLTDQRRIDTLFSVSFMVAIQYSTGYLKIPGWKDDY